MRIMRVDYRRRDGRRCAGFWLTRDENRWHWMPVILPNVLVDALGLEKESEGTR